jgi:2-polyprenyl-3-methyl-5-hydroxy-6-metoxy-1,4-benzoquinol methylase
LSRYETAIDLDNPNNSQTQLIHLVGHDKTVLDVGCAGGDTARALIARGCRVSGVDVDAAAAEPARGILDDLVLADIDETPLSTLFKAESFDAVIFGDVLEHLVDPSAALSDAVSLLRPEGKVLVSIPNVAHGALRLALLGGRWDYTDKGLLDRTHLRFFTLEAVCELLEEAGLAIEVLRSTVLDPMATQEITVPADRLPASIVEWVRNQPRALDYQYVAVARPRSPGEQPARRPALEPAVSYDEARLTDRHTERMLAELEERHRLLTIRDHIMGLEASLATAKNRAARARQRAKSAERRLRKLRSVLTAIVAQIEAISRSKRPRTHLRALAVQLRADLRDADRPGDLLPGERRPAPRD